MCLIARPDPKRFQDLTPSVSDPKRFKRYKKVLLTNLFYSTILELFVTQTTFTDQPQGNCYE
jgi:hypothetical protein